VKRLVPLLLLLVGCSSSYDAPTLADSVGRTYGHLYERSQQQAGNTTAEPVRILAVCVRGGEETPDRGPGDDWRCRVEHLRLNGPPPVTYEVTLKPDGCFTAEGPPAVVAALTTTVRLGVLAVCSVLTGLVVTGRQPLVGLTGQPIGFGHGVLLVGAAWLSTLPIALAVTAGALLVSAATRNSLVAVTVPAVVGALLALTGQLAALGALRPLLLTPGLTAWHGLLTEGTEAGPVLWSTLASLGWAALFVCGAVLVLRRRDWAVP
jgi:hypothetical protein